MFQNKSLLLPSRGEIALETKPLCPANKLVLKTVVAAL